MSHSSAPPSSRRLPRNKKKVHQDARCLVADNIENLPENPLEMCREVNKTFTFQCCYPCREYLSRKIGYKFRSALGIVSIYLHESLPLTPSRPPSWRCTKEIFLQPHTLSLNHRQKLREVFSTIRGISVFAAATFRGFIHSSTCSLTNLIHLQSHSGCAINHFIRPNSSFVLNFWSFSGVEGKRHCFWCLLFVRPNMENYHVNWGRREMSSRLCLSI